MHFVKDWRSAVVKPKSLRTIFTCTLTDTQHFTYSVTHTSKISERIFRSEGDRVYRRRRIEEEEDHDLPLSILVLLPIESTQPRPCHDSQTKPGHHTHNSFLTCVLWRNREVMNEESKRSGNEGCDAPVWLGLIWGATKFRPWNWFLYVWGSAGGSPATSKISYKVPRLIYRS